MKKSCIFSVCENIFQMSYFVKQEVWTSALHSYVAVGHNHESFHFSAEAGLAVAGTGCSVVVTSKGSPQTVWTP